MTADEVKRLMAWTAANFPNMQERDLRPTAELWYKMLADLPYKVAEAALIKVLATAKFFPTVAEIREAAAYVQGGANLPSPAEAWEEVVTQIRVTGRYRVPQWSCEVVARAVRAMGGWQELCDGTEMGVDRAQFMRIYEQYTARQKEQALLPPIVRQFIGATGIGLLPGGKKNGTDD